MMDLSSTGVIAAFAAGVISFLSPCVLPLVPGYVSYVAGHSISGRSANGVPLARLHALALSLYFVLGFSTVFVLLGASATALGQLLLSYRYELNLIGGATVIGFGLFMLGLLHPSWLMRDHRFEVSLPGGRPIAAYTLGIAFAFGWTPCIGPILGAILTVSAASATIAHGVALLGVYSLGLGIPFMLAAAFTDSLLARLKSIGRAGLVLQRLAGGVMIVMGAAMMTGRLSEFSFWLLSTFPFLGRIG
ncbi:MAG: cytochrome c biogenesis protein CcdA [Rhizobiales bacterium]|nr:cytochrome c biogenesis protein CcdA [Hyphomicrobiales bacterium]